MVMIIMIIMIIIVVIMRAIIKALTIINWEFLLLFFFIVMNYMF